VIYIDLDGFKGVNDTMGHAIGDELLVAVSARLSDTLRIIGRARPQFSTSGPKRAPGTDTLARMGGDEFIALVNHTRNAANALQAATRLLASLRQPFAIAGREVNISASMGVALGPGDYATVDDLIRDADAAMYRAKAAGGSQVKLFDTDLETKAAEAVHLRGEIRRGIENNEFLVLYQPIVSLDTGRLHGCEALLRWKHRDALVAPETFLQAAEDTGLIIPLGRWVLRQAGEQAREWRRACPTLPAGFVTVNVSSKELVDASFMPQIDHIVASSNIDRADLKLELTETIAVQDPANTIAVIHQLRSRGHKVTMDDFGTGHSLLTWFKQLPIDGFKIDRSFVRDLETSARSVNIVRLMVDMAKAAEIEVVAEGVETERQATILRELGCPLGQGFLFASPLEADELYEKFIKTAQS
jgi:predicted signal transduction protein with EAL and GGDEF domain